MNKLLLIGLIALVSAAMVGGFLAVGGPGYARLEKHDAQRARDLQALHSFLECRADDKVLPQSLADDDYCPTAIFPEAKRDPLTDALYVYRRVDDTHFEVCATFATDSQKGARGYPYRALKFDGQVGCRAGVVVNVAQ